MADSILLKRVIDHIASCVLITDLSGKIVYANASAHKTLEYSEGGLDWVNLHDILHISDVSQIGGFDLLREHLADGTGSYEADCQMICRTSRLLLCRLNAYGERDSSGNSANVIVVFRDISVERAISDELGRKNIEMARMNSELIRSNQELKRVSEIKTKFLSIASHELKTPLTSIKGYSEIIIDNMRERVDPAVFRMIESISRAADRLHDVINNMLDVSRIEQKKLRLKPETMRLEGVAEECLRDLEQFSQQRRIVFKCCFEPGIPEFYGDRMRMMQVFTNLFSNALKYSPDDSTVLVDIHQENADSLHIIVSDTGIGVDEDEREKIFDPFYEVASPTSHSTGSTKFLGGGTGLGLSIVKGVVERHGGDIWVESAGTMPGKFPGSEFHILLPVRPVIRWDDDENHTIRVRLPERERKLSMPGGASADRPLILIIDDDQEAIEICRMVLSPLYDIETAENGEQGLRFAFTRKPSLVLLDQYLPGLDGAQVCRILKSQEETRDIPLSFFSAATQQSEIQRCFSNGADDFIVKPFNARDLAEKVRRLLNGERGEVD